AGQAMARMHDAIAAGQVPGLNDISDLFADTIHLNDLGNYFMAMVHYAAIYGRDPGDLPEALHGGWGQAFGAPSAALADVMQDIAWQTVSETLALDPADPAPSEPEPVDPAPSDPAPSDPAPSDPTPSDPAPADPVPNDPAPGDPAEARSGLIRIGAAGDDRLVGDDGADILRGRAGNDALAGLGGDDRLAGGRGADSLDGGAGHDALRGRAGGDVLFAGDGDDVLRGGRGRDSLSGQAGDDVIAGGRGDDILAGGAGADVFVFAADWGRDRVADFVQGQDRLDFSNAGVGAASELTILDHAEGALIAWGEDSVLLAGMRADALSASDFIF
ncbi:hemolysin type calcium-binding protein, partial [Oceanicella actignis]